jgi:oligoribonuclease NrnB/cAMP/cGMP phosphodiesterase (DHH superfamily)
MIYAIYHGKCLDGIAAAFAFSVWYDEQARKSREGSLLRMPPVKYFEGTYGEPFPVPLNKLTADDVIYLLDFSAKADVINELTKVVSSVTIIDHHIGVYQEITELAETNDKVTYHYSDKDAGCTLTWKTLMPKKAVPASLRMIADRDLWQFKHRNTKAFCEGLYAQKLSIGLIANATFQDVVAEKLIEDGKAIIAYKENIHQSLIKQENWVLMKIGEKTLVGINVPMQLASEVGNCFLESVANDPLSNHDVVCLFQYMTGKVKLSFRSNVGTALELGKELGGGGHANAAGAIIDATHFYSLLEVTQ